ncbi:MAG TPA: MarR family transcriptional regulator [Galbitalea sp.]
MISRLSRHLNPSAAGLGLTPSQASALSLISVRGPLSLTDLATLEGLNPTMVSRIVGKLDDARLIVRSRDETDLRSATVEATDDGRQVNDLISAQRADAVADRVNRLTLHQQKALFAALPALEALADELNPQITRD